MSDNFFKPNSGLTLWGLPSAPDSPTNGDMYYNTTINKFQFFQDGVWTEGGGGGGLAAKIIYSSRGYADGSQAVACSIATVSNKTRVTVSGYTMITGLNPTQTIGNQKVEVNGQEIERKLVGYNDNIGNIVYEEISGTQIDIYEIVSGPSTAPLFSEAEVRITLVSHAVAELDAINTDILPLTDDLHSLGSASRRWKDVWVGSDSLHVGTNGKITFNETTQKLEFSNDNGTSSLPFGSGSGGGGDSTGDILDTLIRDEADTLSSVIPNQIIDDFGDEDKGFKLNTTQATSALRLTAPSLSGTYERVREANITLNSVRGGVVASLQQIAPKNTAIAANTFKINGDVTNMFSASKKVLIAKKMTSDGSTILKFLLNSDGIPAALAVSVTPTYNSVLDETTLTLSNPDVLDLDMDVSSGNYNSTLRIIPFDYKIEAKTLSASAYEEAAIDDIQTLPDIRIPGENFFKELSGLLGTALMITANSSKNGQYLVVRYWERRSDLAAHLYHWFYSTDRGTSWTKFSTTKDSGGKTAFIDQLGASAHQNNDQMTFVADNGKMFSCYLYQSGGFDAIRAVYSDLSAGTPVLTDSIDVGQGSGVIAAAGSTHYYGTVAGDTVDASMVVCSYTDYNSSSMGIRVFANGGASVLSTSVSGSMTQSALLVGLFVSGSGTSHRVHAIRRDGQTDGNIAYQYFDQPTYSWSSTLSVESGNHIELANSISGSRLVTMYQNNPYSYVKYATWTSSFGSPPSAVTKGTLITSSSYLNVDEYLGWSTTFNSGLTQHRVGNKRIIQNPSDDKHCLFIADFTSSSENVRRPYIFEVQDVTAFRGIQISQYIDASAENLNNLTTRQRIGQTFTATAGQKVRTIAMKLFRAGTAPITGQVTCHIYNVNISTGLPTTILASSLNTLDVSRVNVSSNGVAYFFKFNNVDLATTQYAMVLSTTQTIDATNMIRWNNANTNNYAGGAPVQFDGVSWTLSAVTSDYAFEIHGDYIHDLGMENPTLFAQGTVNQFNFNSESQMSQIFPVSATNFVISTRRLVAYSDSSRPFSGHIFRSVGSLSAPSVSPSSLSPLAIAGYSPSNYDQNMIFSTALGTDACAQLSVSGTPGVIDTSKKGEDRAGLCMFNNAYFNMTAGDYPADSSFQSGFCAQFNGSNKDISYTHHDVQNLQSNRPFAIEAEFKVLSGATTNQVLISKYNSSNSYGWVLQLNPPTAVNSTIEFAMLSSSGTLIARALSVNGTIALNTYYVVRVTYAGDGTTPKMFLSTTGPNGTFTEVNYSAQNSVTGNTVNNGPMIIGSHMNIAFLNGKVGYVKIMKGLVGTSSPAFAYTGWKNQAAMQIVNLGNKFAAVQLIGKNNNTTGTGNEQFFKAGIIDGQYANQAAMVDSNDLALYYGKTLENATGSTMHLKASLNRASTRDASSIQGLNFRYSK